MRAAGAAAREGKEAASEAAGVREKARARLKAAREAQAKAAAAAKAEAQQREQELRQEAAELRGEVSKMMASRNAAATATPQTLSPDAAGLWRRLHAAHAAAMAFHDFEHFVIWP